MHINESIPVTITHVKENRKTAGKRVMCGHDDHAEFIYRSKGIDIQDCFYHLFINRTI
jgi:hypothetical protein